MWVKIRHNKYCLTHSKTHATAEMKRLFSEAHSLELYTPPENSSCTRNMKVQLHEKNPQKLCIKRHKSAKTKSLPSNTGLRSPEKQKQKTAEECYALLSWRTSESTMKFLLCSRAKQDLLLHDDTHARRAARAIKRNTHSVPKHESLDKNPVITLTAFRKYFFFFIFL